MAVGDDGGVKNAEYCSLIVFCRMQFDCYKFILLE